MQSFMDSLCRCWGTETLPDDVMAEDVPATPEMKRRTRSLALQDKQWDALFQDGSSRPQTPQTESLICSPNMDHAQAVAKAKLAAHSRPKRKRSRSASRDEIFRSKEPKTAPSRGSAPNPFSRFLSKHPVIANSLCFATPVKDSQEPDEVPYSNSMTSDTNTLNTAEDTVTSTVYYEKTKLAHLQQTTPPMPLFSTYAVEERDEIHRIVATESHSSAKRMDNLYTIPTCHYPLCNEDEEEEEVDDGILQDANLPPMTAASSSHSDSSKGSK